MKLKKIIAGIIIVILNVFVITITNFIFDGNISEEKRVEKALKEQDKSLNDLEQYIFEYNADYKMQDGSIKNIICKEIYYYNGKKFILMSDFLKGGNQK